MSYGDAGPLTDGRRVRVREDHGDRDSVSSSSVHGGVGKKVTSGTVVSTGPREHTESETIDPPTVVGDGGSGLGLLPGSHDTSS